MQILHWQEYLDLNTSAGARLSRACVDIIRRLCCDKRRRLGLGGAHEVKSHAWFEVRKPAMRRLRGASHIFTATTFADCRLQNTSLIARRAHSKS